MDLRRPVPERVAQELLGDGFSLSWLLLVNAVAFLVGVRFYVESDPSLREVHTLLWPFFGDSPAAIALATLSLATLLPVLGRRVRDAPVNRPLAYLHTLAFAWLVKYGLWTFVALTLRPDLYVGFSGAALWDYWGIVLTHLGFVVEAYLVPWYGRTTRGALALTAVALLANDVLDYGFGYYPPLRYDPGVVLAGVTVGLSLLSVALASRAFDRLDA